MSGSTQGKLRRLVQADVQAALQLSMQAGWNQTADDWSMLLQLAPHSCLAIEIPIRARGGLFSIIDEEGSNKIHR